MPVKRIGLLLNFSDSYDTKVTSGILSAAKELDWALYGKGHGFSKLEEVKLDGIIARIESEEDALWCLSSGVPVVDIAGAFGPERFSIVKNDDRETGRCCSDFLMQSGASSLACLLVKGTVWSDERLSGFKETAGERNIRTFSESLAWWKDTYGKTEQLENFLKALEKPAALFAVNDLTAFKTVLAAKKAGIRIPEDMVIVSVDNEEILCQLSKPSLSSLSLQLEAIGREAALRLEEILTTGNTRNTLKLIPPAMLEERESTRNCFCGDKLVAAAVMNIKQKASSGLSCKDIIKDLPISRRRLEERFKAARGRTLLEEVQEERLREAERLLLRTNGKIEEIWRNAGFGSPQRFFFLFKKRHGMTPAAWREKLKDGMET